MFLGCGSNGVTIANGSAGPVGYSCLYGSDYEYKSAVSSDVVSTNNYILQDDSGSDLKVTLGPGYWVVKVIVTTKNTDATGGHADVMRVYLDGGVLNAFGSDQMSGYSHSAVDGDAYFEYQVCSVTSEILSGTKDITVKMQVGEGTGTFIALSRTIVAYKITSYNLI